MPPKKAKKISLNEFLGDNALGSWADEMDSLPSAPAVRTDEELARGNDRYGRRDDFLSTRPDRGMGPPREDLPLPTQPPYTAFIGNLAFDLTEQELEEFFGSSKTKSIKIIKDREEKPKGFGYIEFADLESLKDALAKSGANFSGRTIRVSVAEPPKERAGFGGFEDDSKFDNPWRRDGPLPPSSDSRDSSRRRFDAPSGGDRERSLPSLSEGPSDWRSSRPARTTTPLDTDTSSYKRKGSGFSTPDGQPSSADREEVWAIGSKFKPAPAASEDSGSGRFGGARGRGDMGPPKEPVIEESDWRTARPKPVSRDSVSPNSSTPPTPQLNRRKLELLPRSGTVSTAPSPLSSPKIGPTPPVSAAPRSSPFGAAKPVDVTPREKEVAERVEKDREMVKEKLTMSRTSSRTATERTAFNRARTPPPGSAPQSPKSPKLGPTAAPKVASTAPTVRPTLSFASAAAKKENVPEKSAEGDVEPKAVDADVGRAADAVAEVTI
ncbi:hypothetical protein B0H15DRAFT_844986 [Mycena belliarum]|uniref:RRM domain-containing protein n=1 Tax=Mycena belliarum TaxID=1033014 RepID=A0AAD6U2G9_9AGAR|nr:hypothetical protein B0H15DRAFT_844986 [Mycena belliae]